MEDITAKAGARLGRDAFVQLLASALRQQPSGAAVDILAYAGTEACLHASQLLFVAVVHAC